MKPRSKTNKIINIGLIEEKYYFPGETIKGNVIVNPKSSIKVNPIIIKFSGVVYISGKDKEVISLFDEKKTIVVNNGKSKILEAKRYDFPFEFVVPNNIPSAMEFGKNKMIRIHYKLTAILAKPLMPESICPKVDYPVLILEYIDVTKENYKKPAEETKDAKSVQNGDSVAKLGTVRTGYTRGETIPVELVINTTQALSRKEGIVIDLIQEYKIQTPKNKLKEEKIIKTNKYDLNIIGPYNFSQLISSQFLVRTTPPTICYKSNMLVINYKIRATIQLGNNLQVELPIVIGTWPRADIPIDDDDDDEDVMMKAESDEDDSWMEEQEEVEFKRYSTHSNFHTVPSPRMNSNLHPQHKRTGSNGSMGSMSSWKTNSTTDYRMSNTPSIFTTSPTTTTTTSTLPTPIGNNSPSFDHYRTPNTTNNYNNTITYLNRSSSTPDLVTITPPPVTPQQNRMRVIDPLQSFYNPPPHGNRINQAGFIPPHYVPYASTSTQTHRRLASEDYNTFKQNNGYLNEQPLGYLNETQHGYHLQDQYNTFGSDQNNNYMNDQRHHYQHPTPPSIPNHTLTVISPPTYPNPSSSPLPIHESLDELPESSDDEDEGDLFAIIEKKKKREERERRMRMDTFA